MPITKSAKKALRQSLKRKSRNLIYKNRIKSAIKGVKKMISQKKTEEAKKNIPKIYKMIDKAAKVGVIKSRTAGRRKSYITKLTNKT